MSAFGAAVVKAGMAAMVGYEIAKSTESEKVIKIEAPTMQPTQANVHVEIKDLLIAVMAVFFIIAFVFAIKQMKGKKHNSIENI